jgi:cholesterol transport system auxiliary component
MLSLGAGGALLSGCAIFSKAEQMSPRYFSPATDLMPGGVQPGEPSKLELRLGQIDSAAHLEERIAYRLSDTELGYYQDRRWTEPPEEYLRRALAHELFERRRLGRVVAGAAPTLDVELVSFEQVRHGPPRARLALRFSLRDERRSLLERAIVVEEPLEPAAAKEEAEQLANALSGALSRAVTQLADLTIAQLELARGSP